MLSETAAANDKAERPDIVEADVRDALCRVLACAEFAASERRREFLRHIVEECLAGRGASLKGYNIAVDVFHRDEDFDSQADPVVRLEARRLRRDLDSYYMGPGSQDPVRIFIPKGAYVPHYEWRDVPSAPLLEIPPEHPASADETNPPPPDAEKPGASRVRLFQISGAIVAMAVIAVAIAVTGVFRSPTQPVPMSKGEPSVIVAAFEYDGTYAETEALASGITYQLINNLMRFPGFRVYSKLAGSPPRAGSPAIADSTADATYIVSGNVQTSDDNLRLWTRVADAATGRLLWSGSYNRPLAPKALITLQGELAGEIATALGQPYGIINDDLLNRAASADSPDIQSYICVLKAYTYRRNFSKAQFGPTLKCLEDAVRRDPDYSDAWAMLGWLHLDAGRFEFAPAAEMEAEYQKGFDAATQAIRLEPQNLLALKALSSISFYMGYFEDAERLARQAAALNPHDSDTLAQLGWRLAVRGNFEEGIPILKHAIGRNAAPPPWYFHLISIDHFLKGEYDEMYKSAERFSGHLLGVSQGLWAIANWARCDMDEAQRALDRMISHEPIARDIPAYLRRHGATDRIADAISKAIEHAKGGACPTADQLSAHTTPL
ncbi:hypothetical protein RDV64_19515 [Acuticoccus sp. MNP-M23]|uniref:hypothetical protein n=1 Tax=Acuticoccus sp. MNP-M23 TaxID=3072793 RepID=UPI002814B3EA|nr:hypothetical protein [Acuticoccus sp. MNP-M23]WMS42231.1 hypothetical protein RDV64_19515 [Acuticoccus sp. MNP-M23]